MNLKNVAFGGLAAAFVALASAPVVAQSAAPAVAQSAALTAGEIRKVDADQGKVTIKHEPIQNLDMPAMTMVFRAAKPELLKDVKAGDKVQFRVESVAGAFVVTELHSGH